MPSPSLVLLRTQSDARLVALARDGHERAFEAIVERYRRPLQRACRRVLPEARAEDALQQSLMAAWRGLQRGDEVRELRPWLHRIARNTSLNLLRQSGYDYEQLQESLRIPDAADDELERRAVIRQTLQGLAALPPRQREALLAIAVEGRSQDEVADDLGLSAGAVRQLVHRARSALRAAATAVVPTPLVAWAASASTRGELTARIAELSAGAGGVGAAATLAKAGTVAVIAGGAVAGPALIEKRVSGPQAPATAQAPPRGEREARPPTGAPDPVTVAVPARDLRPAGSLRASEQHRPAAAAGPRPIGGRDDDERPSRSRSGPSESDRDDLEAGDDPGSRRGRSDGDESDRSGPSGEDGSDRSGPSGDDELELESDGHSGPSRRSGTSGSGGGDDGELAAPSPSPTPEPADEPESDGSGSGSGGEYESHDD